MSSSSIYSIIIIFHQVWLFSYVESLLSLLYVRHIKLLYLIHTIVPRHQYFCQKINDNIIISKIFNDIKTLYHFSLKTLGIFTHPWEEICWRWKCHLWTTEFQIHYPIQWDQLEAPDSGQSFHLAKSMKVFKLMKKCWHVCKTEQKMPSDSMSASTALRCMEKHKPN